jgi:hypothetical protein
MVLLGPERLKRTGQVWLWACTRLADPAVRQMINGWRDRSAIIPLGVRPTIRVELSS